MAHSRIIALLILLPAFLAVPAGRAFAAGGGFFGLSAMELTSLFCLVVVGSWALSRIRYYKSRGPNDTTKKRAADAWQYLRDTPEQTDPAAQEAAPAAPNPDGFDQADFMDGARILYGRLQTAWAAREMDALRPFVSDAMLAVIEEESRRDPTPREVTVVLVEGSFAGLEKNGQGECATVLFKALLREGGAAPAEVREKWRFVRGPNTDGMWRLDAVDAAEPA